jgi:hypothetical protein
MRSPQALRYALPVRKPRPRPRRILKRPTPPGPLAQAGPGRASTPTTRARRDPTPCAPRFPSRTPGATFLDRPLEGAHEEPGPGPRRNRASTGEVFRGRRGAGGRAVRCVGEDELVHDVHQGARRGRRHGGGGGGDRVVGVGVGGGDGVGVGGESGGDRRGGAAGVDHERLLHRLLWNCSCRRRRRRRTIGVAGVGGFGGGLGRVAGGVPYGDGDEENGADGAERDGDDVGGAVGGELAAGRSRRGGEERLALSAHAVRHRRRRRRVGAGAGRAQHAGGAAVDGGVGAGGAHSAVVVGVEPRGGARLAGDARAAPRRAGQGRVEARAAADAGGGAREAVVGPRRTLRAHVGADRARVGARPARDALGPAGAAYGCRVLADWAQRAKH